LQRLGFSCPALKQYVVKICDAIGGRIAEIQDGRTYAARLLLKKVDPKIAVHRRTAVRFPDISSLLLGDEEAVDQVPSIVAAATVFGRDMIPLTARTTYNLRCVLQVLTLHAFHRYNLDLGLRLLRAMGYLRLQETRPFGIALEFALRQVQADGRFGFLGPEASVLERRNRNFDRTVDLYLPLTVSALWTFAETTNPAFVLYDSV